VCINIKFSNIGNRRSFSFFSLFLEGNFDLPNQFQKNIEDDHTAAQILLSEIPIYCRKRDAARRAALFIIARYGEGDLAVFNRDLIRLLAREVWKTREDDAWMDASEESNSNSSKRIKNV
jgi:hypothetical protein